MSSKTYKVVTNNPLVKESLGESTELYYFEDDTHRDILERVRDFVHQGYRILTHPLAGSVKPWETPYRSVMITAEGEDNIDNFSRAKIACSIISREKISILSSPSAVIITER